MGLESNPAGDFPQIAPTAFVHPAATVIGKVSVEGRCFVGPGAVLRADEPGPNGVVRPIVVGEGSNVQDCVVMHALGGTGVKIGPGSSIAHAAVIHGPCEIGANCFVGFGSLVFNATLGDGVIVMHRAVVEGATIPAGLHVPTVTAIRCEEHVRSLEPTTPDLQAFAREVVQTNLRFAEAGLRKIHQGE